MTFNRNKKEDIENTKKILLNPQEISNDGKNWLGHSRAAGIIDQMLINGATEPELGRSGRKVNAIKSHLNHLKSEHGLSLTKTDGVWKYNYQTIPDINISFQNLSKNDESNENYLPTKEDCDRAIRELHNEGYDATTDNVLDRIKQNVTSQRFVLKSNWKLITEKNMELWSS